MSKLRKLSPEQRSDRKRNFRSLLPRLCREARQKLRRVFRGKQDQLPEASETAAATAQPVPEATTQEQTRVGLDKCQRPPPEQKDADISKAKVVSKDNIGHEAKAYSGDREAGERKEQHINEDEIAELAASGQHQEGARVEQEREDEEGTEKEGTKELPPLDPHLAPFLEVIDTLDLDKLKEFALALRQQQLLDCDCLIGCKCISKIPKYGSYNLVYIIEFTDGVKWCARVPGYGKKPSKVLGEKMDIEYSTMKYIKTYTSFPVPDVIYWTKDQAEVGAAFALISFVEGTSLSEMWFDHENFDEEKRLAALESVAMQMRKLYMLQFKKTGMLRWDQEDLEMLCDVGPALDYYDNGSCLWAGVIRRHQDEDFGEWLDGAVNRLDKEAPDEEFCSANAPLKLLAKSLPKHMRHVPLALSLADLDLQNVFVDPRTGEVAGFIDFDGVAVRPVHIGAAAYPMWLTRDFDPNNYAWQPGHQFEDSPEDLTRYRQHYADCWRDCVDTGLEYDERWTENSHLVTTIFNALVLKPYRESMTYALVDHAFNAAFNPTLEERSLWWDCCWDDFEPWKLKVAIGRGLWLKRTRRAAAVILAKDVGARTTSSLKKSRDYWKANRAMLNTCI
ncbi:hypothetical protein OHC33_010666 [Knufia fluminis]|uniref:Aminoglycoside phosphotransferase domain-containing protein n=1 Tax=Knufia fluminis TaxID=191047 RepID=A0AAN8E9E2_9EURO|nr:hypothetical protein OHC33_010666 [Knufia fluminis]